MTTTTTVTDTTTTTIVTDTPAEPVAEKKVRKSPKPKLVKCSACGAERFSQAMRAVVGGPDDRQYVCKKCPTPMTKVVIDTETVAKDV
jgi:hypothetical protein